jgi:hypothetical protein
VWSADSCEPGEVDEQNEEWSLVLWPAVELRRLNATQPPSGAADLLPTWLLENSQAPSLELITEPQRLACPPWRRARPVTLARYGGEWDRFRLLECDGSVAADAIDRLSVIARPPGRERPTLPLPDEPDPSSPVAGEWLPQVRMVHPRLVWLVQRIADAFPRRMVYVISGYRPEAPAASLHHRGRALDLFVHGVNNASLFRYCRTLRDVGCGYYPNSNFVHIDIRPFGSPRVYWVDTAGPGEPAQYVDSWPGVVSGGALQWAGAE